MFWIIFGIVLLVLILTLAFFFFKDDNCCCSDEDYQWDGYENHYYGNRPDDV